MIQMIVLFAVFVMLNALLVFLYAIDVIFDPMIGIVAIGIEAISVWILVMYLVVKDKR